jgi:hypothetical protein
VGKKEAGLHTGKGGGPPGIICCSSRGAGRHEGENSGAAGSYVKLIVHWIGMEKVDSQQSGVSSRQPVRHLGRKDYSQSAYNESIFITRRRLLAQNSRAEILLFLKVALKILFR